MSQQRSKELVLFNLVRQWLDTGDIYYRDTIKSHLTPPSPFPSAFEQNCVMHFIERPDDQHYLNNVLDAVAKGKAQPNLLR